MRQFLAALIVLGMTGISQASTNLEIGSSPTITAGPAKTVIRNAPVFAQSIHRIPRSKVLRANPYRYSRFVADGDNDDFIDDDGLITPYRRRDLQKIVTEPNELPDRIMTRLASAREAALAKYRETWG